MNYINAYYFKECNDKLMKKNLGTIIGGCILSGMSLSTFITGAKLLWDNSYVRNTVIAESLRRETELDHESYLRANEKTNEKLVCWLLLV